MFRKGYLKGYTAARTIQSKDGQMQVRDLRIGIPYTTSTVNGEQTVAEDELICGCFADLNEESLNEMVEKKTEISFNLNCKVREHDGREFNSISISSIKISV